MRRRNLQLIINVYYLQNCSVVNLYRRYPWKKRSIDDVMKFVIWLFLEMWCAIPYLKYRLEILLQMNLTDFEESTMSSNFRHDIIVNKMTGHVSWISDISLWLKFGDNTFYRTKIMQIYILQRFDLKNFREFVFSLKL